MYLDKYQMYEGGKVKTLRHRQFPIKQDINIPEELFENFSKDQDIRSGVNTFLPGININRLVPEAAPVFVLLQNGLRRKFMRRQKGRS